MMLVRASYSRMQTRGSPQWPRSALLLLVCLFLRLLPGAPLAFADEPFMPALEANGEAPPGYDLVFGRVVLVEDGEEKSFGLFTELHLFVTSLESGRTERVRFLGENNFYWALKPGKYVISAYFYNRTSGRIWAAFTIPEASRAVYIGDLTLRFDTKLRRYGYSIADNYQTSVERETARLAAAKIEPVNAVMRREEQPGSYTRIGGICAKAWGLECTRNYQGLKPVLPERVNEENFPLVASLTPLLEWEPTKAEGVTYDVAVYEALHLSGVEGLPGNRYQQGKIAIYAENLRDPRFQIESALKPGQKYLWSVRMRKGDTVSTWSTTGFFAFFIVGWASGSGNWFGFMTPGP
jgi:hypothetical protein